MGFSRELARYVWLPGKVVASGGPKLRARFTQTSHIWRSIPVIPLPGAYGDTREVSLFRTQESLRVVSVNRSSRHVAQRYLAVAGVACCVLLWANPPLFAQRLVNALEISGQAIDALPGPGANRNRLGGFGSDLAYDLESGLWYGLVDRGPGGGVLPFQARIQEFQLDVDPDTGRIANFTLVSSIRLLSESKQALNGLNPLAHEEPWQQDLSFDAEGLAGTPRGHWYISDEYGPSIRRFSPDSKSRSSRGPVAATWTSCQLLKPPDTLRPIDASGQRNMVPDKSGPPAVVAGRAPNRGFEGLAIAPSGEFLYAMLQSPLVDEGPAHDGEQGRFVRIVEFDTSTGHSTRQFFYELESVAEINRRIVDETALFKPKKQGRAVGVSALVALNDHQFLVLERDNRGIGIDNPDNKDPILRHVGSKRLYEIDLSQATDVSQVSLAGCDELPPHIRPVNKRLFLDLQAEIEAARLPIPEKIEGVAVGPRLRNGNFLLLVATDNDFSVTQTTGATQYDVYSDGTKGPLDGDAGGRSLLPTWLYAFQVELPSATR